MKISLAYVVHGVHDTEVLVAAVVPDGDQKGRAVKAPIPALIVECVPAGGDHHRSFTFPVITRTPEEHAEALKRFGFGAEISIEITAEGEGKTPHEVKMGAVPVHILESEALVAGAQATLDGLPATADETTRKAARERLETHKADLAAHRARLAKHLGPDAATAAVDRARQALTQAKE